MNRRNFLKLFGLLAAIPTTASAMRGIKPPPSFQQMTARKKKREINIYITLENRFHEIHGKHRLIIRKKRADGKWHAANYGEWTDSFLMHGRYVDADDMLTIEIQNGNTVNFTPIPNPYQEGKFESVNITWWQALYSDGRLMATPIL